MATPIIDTEAEDSAKQAEAMRRAVRRYRQTPKGIAIRSKCNNNRRQKMIAQGLCTYCQKVPPEGKYRACRPCLDRVATLTRERRDGLVRTGKCIRCGKLDCLPAMRGRTESFCELCYFRNAAGGRLLNYGAWEAIRAKFYAQDGRCAYTGEQIILGLNDSLDHILPISKFPELRHDPANTEWVTRKVNCMKWDSTRDEFIATAYAVVRHYESQNQAPS